jgi:3',5'-cyclic AMP phosphodiesterase CpdA
VQRFAKEKPFVLVTGNHETRGAFARKLFNVYPHSSGRFYYSFTHGGVYFMVLAAGEDKEDAHPVYAGLNLFDEYRAEQARWMEQELSSNAAKSARYRIVFTHIPAYNDLDAVARRRPGADSEPVAHTIALLSKLWAPVLRKGNVDLVVSGHTHRSAWFAPNPEKGEYALFVGSNQEIGTFKVTDKALEIEAQDTAGNARSYKVPKR